MMTQVLQHLMAIHQVWMIHHEDKGWFECDPFNIDETLFSKDNKASPKAEKRDFIFFVLLLWESLDIRQRFNSQSGDGGWINSGVPDLVQQRYEIGNVMQNGKDPAHQFETIFKYQFLNNVMLWMYIMRSKIYY